MAMLNNQMVSVCWVQKWSNARVSKKTASQWLTSTRLRAPVPCAASGVHSHIYLHTCHGGHVPERIGHRFSTKHPPHSSSKFCFCAQLPLLNSRSPAWHTIPKKNWYSRIQMRLIGGEARPRHDCQFFDGTLKGPNTNLNMLCGRKKNC